MAIPTLSGSYIDETYQRLVQVSGSEFADGLGNPISFGGATIPNGPINSLQYNLDGTTFSGSGNFTFVNNNLVLLTGSLIATSITSSLQGTASQALTASYAENGLKNGTSGYIPLWNGNSTLTSSFITQTATEIKTIYNGTETGIDIDFTNNIYKLGKEFGANAAGLIIDTNTGEYYLGDYNNAVNNGTSIQVQDNSSLIQGSYSGSATGILLDFGNDLYSIGDLSNIGSGSKIIVDDFQQKIFLSKSTIITGSLTTTEPITGSLYGTASFTTTASYALVAQTLLGSVESASYAATASYVENAQTASYALNAVSSSYALTASYVEGATNPTLQDVVNNGNTFSGTIIADASPSSSITSVSGSTYVALNFFDTNIGGISLTRLDGNDYSVFAHNGNDDIFNSGKSTTSIIKSKLNQNGLAAKLLTQDSSLDIALLDDANTTYGVGAGIITPLSSTSSILFRSEELPNDDLTYTTAASLGTSRNIFLYATQNQTSTDNTINSRAITINTGSIVFESELGTSLTFTDYSIIVGNSHSITGSLSGTSSWAENAITASYALTAQTLLGSVESASYAATASYVNGIIIKNNVVAAGSFTGSPLTTTVTFTTAFPNANYTVTVTGENSRTWTIENKLSGSFVINSNSSVALTGNTYWQAISYGEFNG